MSILQIRQYAVYLYPNNLYKVLMPNSKPHLKPFDRILRYGCGLLSILFLASCAYHREEVCYQCKARRHFFWVHLFSPNLFIKPGPHTKYFEEMLGEPCPHNAWKTKSTWFFVFHGDNLSPIPIDTLWNAYCVPQANPEQRRQMALALGTKKNLLKWVAVEVIYDVKNIYPDLVESEEAWDKWWSENEEVFQIVTDEEQSREIALRTRNRLRDDPE